jgi:F1F0 ATPase subunit 2
MSDAMTLAAAFLAGGAFGAIFFGGLWWTITRGTASKRPAQWFLASLLLRMGIVLMGFYFVAGGHWERLVTCLLGFLAARIAVARLIGEHGGQHTRTTKEVRHAP